MNTARPLDRAAVRVHLAERDLGPIVEGAVVRNAVMRAVTSLLFAPEPLIRWRAVETLGLAAARRAEVAIEKVRRQVRDLLWLMNDESGGLCRMAPEAIGEIVFRVPKLLGEYGVLLPQFFDEEPFERGSRWAVARLAPLQPDSFTGAVPRLVSSLDEPDPVIRGYALLALNAIGDKTAAERAEKLSDDAVPVPVYDFETGRLDDITVGELARRYCGNSSSE